MSTQLRGTDRMPVARDLAARYRDGQSIRQIAQDIGRPYNFVWRLLSDAGVQFRGRGGNQYANKKKENRVTDTHGLTVEQVPDARLVEMMCHVRPGLPMAYADLALQALRTLHWRVHPESAACSERPDPRAGLCAAGTDGVHGRWLCVLPDRHADMYHHDGRGNRWRTVGQMPGPRRP